GDRAPESRQRRARALAPAAHVAVDQHRRVHRPGRGAGNAFDLQPLLLEQAVEHAPGEGAMGTAALQGQVDLQRHAPARRPGPAPAAAPGGGWATGGQGHGVDPEGGMAAWRHDHRPPALRTRAAIDALPGTAPTTGTAARLPRYRPGQAR